MDALTPEERAKSNRDNRDFEERMRRSFPHFRVVSLPACQSGDSGDEITVNSVWLRGFWLLAREGMVPAEAEPAHVTPRTSV